ncbi:unnamed protein product, partial [marine sediment metagenome]
MVEKALTAYDDDSFMDFMSMIVMGILMLAVVISTVVTPITQQAQAQAYLGRTVTKKVNADSTL